AATVAADPVMGHTLEVALAQLPADQREAVLLHKLQGLSFPEIATALGTTAGAARLRAHRGYERLKRLLVNAEGTAVGNIHPVSEAIMDGDPATLPALARARAAALAELRAHPRPVSPSRTWRRQAAGVALTVLASTALVLEVGSLLSIVDLDRLGRRALPVT